MASLKNCAPNRYLIAISGLLLIMAISITMAVMFPYVDVNAQHDVEGASDHGNIRGNYVDGIGAVSNIGGVVVSEIEGEFANDAESAAPASDGSGDTSAIIESDVAEEEKELDEIKEVVTTSNEAEDSDNGESSSSVVSNPVENGANSVVSESNNGDEETSSVESVAAEDEETTSSVESVVNAPVTTAEEVPVVEQPVSTSSNEPIIANNNNVNNPAEDSQSTATSHQSLFDHEDTTLSASTMDEEATTTENNIEQQQCHSLLHLANTHFSNKSQNNNIMDTTEYVTFITNLLETMPGENKGTLADQYYDLPMSLQVNFQRLSCLCPNSTKSECCAETNGIYLVEDMGDGGSSSLDMICDETIKALESVVG